MKSFLLISYPPMFLWPCSLTPKTLHVIFPISPCYYGLVHSHLRLSMLFISYLSMLLWLSSLTPKTLHAIYFLFLHAIMASFTHTEDFPCYLFPISPCYYGIVHSHRRLSMLFISYFSMLLWPSSLTPKTSHAIYFLSLHAIMA